MHKPLKSEFILMKCFRRTDDHQHGQVVKVVSGLPNNLQVESRGRGVIKALLMIDLENF